MPREKDQRPRYYDMEPGTPPLDRPYLAAWLQELNFCKSTAMGIEGYSWIEIESWSRTTAHYADPWETECLYRASLAYAAMWSQAHKPECESPWREAKLDAQTMMRQLKALFRGMIKSPPKEDLT